MKNIRLNITRFNPEIDESQYIETLDNVPFDSTETVIDVLLRIRDNIDPSIAFRYSCKCTICGSCAMCINDLSRLACETKIIDVEKDGEVSIAPLKNFPVIKDLVANIEPMIESLKKITPWLIRDYTKPLPQKEFVIKPEEISQTLQRIDRCIICGICSSRQGYNSISKSSIDPIAMVKNMKYVLDPRDSISEARIIQLVELGLLKQAEECTDYCPKGIDFTNDITKTLKKNAKEIGIL